MKGFIKGNEVGLVLTKREAIVIWHRLNMSDTLFKKHYTNASGSVEEILDAYSEWSDFDKIARDLIEKDS